MENPGFLPDLAVTANPPQADNVPRCYGALAYLRGRRGLLLVVAALGFIAFFAGWRWFGAAAMLPLLYTLPCAAMMAMCMRGHGAPRNTSNVPNNSAGSGPDAGR
jgi:hypothetical protein